MKTKIIKMKPLVFTSCLRCPYHYENMQVKHWFTYTENHFCTASFYHLADAKELGIPICFAVNSKTDVYVYVKNPDEIPDTCPLDNYE